MKTPEDYYISRDLKGVVYIFDEQGRIKRLTGKSITKYEE